MTQVDYAHISPSGKITTTSSLDELKPLIADGGYLWLNYRCPTKDALSEAAQYFHLHHLSIEDCVDNNQVPKIEEYPGYVFTIFNAISYNEQQLTIDEVDIFTGSDYVITVSGYDLNSEDPVSDLHKVVTSSKEQLGQSPTTLMYTVIDFIVDQHYHAVETLDDELESSEDEMLSSPDMYDPSKMMRLRRTLAEIRKSLYHEREMLVKISRGDYADIADVELLHFRDVYDHLSKFLELVESYRDRLTTLMELFTSMQNNIMARSANTTNETMRRLTYITTIFMPLTLLSGIGGMSEFTMMTGPNNWRTAYAVMMFVMVVIALATYLLLRCINNE